MNEAVVFGIMAAAVVVAMILVARYQTGRYRAYLADHIAETRKLAEQQEKLGAITERQAIAMERIAAALEARKHA